MKKIVLVLSSLFLLSFGLFAQTTDLNSAINSSAREISNKLPVKSTVAVVTFFSDTTELSNHVSNLMVKGINNNGLQKVVERDPKKWH